jgi:O-succinylbenzoic acid--CoA ligase
MKKEHPSFTIEWAGTVFAIPEQLDALRTAASVGAQGLALIKFLENWYGSDESIRQSTSGSTGPPKEILIEKRKMQASARRTNAFFSLDGKSIFLIALGVDYIAGKMQLVRAMEAEGHAIAQVPSSDPLSILDRAVSFATLIPAQLEMGMAHLDKVETVLLGGVAPTAVQSKIFSETPRSEIWLGYGMTETCSHVALQRLTSNKEEVFVAMEGVHCSVNDLDELCIQDDHLDLELRTADRVELMDERRFRWLGRSDQVINWSAYFSRCFLF